MDSQVAAGLLVLWLSRAGMCFAQGVKRRVAYTGSEGVFARKDTLRRSSHVDVVIRLRPLDVQVTARKRDGARAFGLSRKHSCDRERASPRAACQRRPGTALPHLHLEVGRRQHLHELGVRLRGKHGGDLELRANGVEVELLEVVNEDDGVRIAHANARHFPLLASHGERGLDDATLFIRRQSRRHIGRFEKWFAHVDAYVTIGLHARLDQSSERRDCADPIFTSVVVRHKLGHTADAVAAHLRL
mmetsp:Transcript_17999/g.46024  ORF Transcript_17999/g.46024 Transcript_17999/m.46024 type:complete len:245 (+) Transcript_17999:214-948(+)